MMPQMPLPIGTRMQPNDNGTSPHILTTSATMLGVCMTVLSLSRLDAAPTGYWLIDKIVAVAALVFLTSCFLSFLSMRRHEQTALSSARFERLAEYLFMGGLFTLGIGAIILAFIVQ